MCCVVSIITSFVMLTDMNLFVCYNRANVGGTLLDCEEAGGSEYNDFITAGTSSTCVVSFAQASKPEYCYSMRW